MTKRIASRLSLMAAVAGVAGVLGATAAHADPIVSIGLGVNGGSVTQVSSGIGFASYSSGANYNGYLLTSISGTGAPPLTGNSLFNTNTINLTTSGTSNVLDIYITESGLTSPNGLIDFNSSFTENSLTSGWTVAESTYFNSTNALWGGTLLGSANFTAIGTHETSTSMNTGSGPYSITAEYVVTPDSITGSSNSTINVSTPEPGALVMFAAGLLGCALFINRRRRASRQS